MVFIGINGSRPRSVVLASYLSLLSEYNIARCSSVVDTKDVHWYVAMRSWMSGCYRFAGERDERVPLGWAAAGGVGQGEMSGVQPIKGIGHALVVAFSR